MWGMVYLSMHYFCQKSNSKVLEQSCLTLGKKDRLHKDIIKLLPETSGTDWWILIDKQSLITEVKVASCLSDDDICPIKLTTDK